MTIHHHRQIFKTRLYFSNQPSFTMLFKSIIAVAALVGSTFAQRDANTSICDYYTTALLKDNNATTQYTLLTLLVNTVVIGNYTQPNMNAVPGILAANATFNGNKVNLAPFFTGALASSNRNNVPTAINFLDDGGAIPLTLNKPANGTSSHQFTLLTHLYQFFGGALGCSQYGMTGFASYGGVASMYELHKFMDLGPNEVGYFIQQVGLAAQSFGVTSDDVSTVGTLLSSIFDVQCGPATTVIPAQGPQLQSICIQSGCTQAANASCGLYQTNITAPSSGSVSPTSTSPAGSSGTSGSKSGAKAAGFDGSVRALGAVAALVVAGGALLL